MTLEEIDAFLATLRPMVASGVLSARTADGKQITYRSTADLLAAVNYYEGQRALLTGVTPAMKVRPQIFLVRAVRDR